MVSSLLKINLYTSLKQPRLSILLAIFVFVTAIFANVFTSEYLKLQASNTEKLSVSGDIFAPLASIALLSVLLIMPILTTMLHPSRVANGTHRLLISYPYPQYKHFINDWIISSFLLSIFHVCLLLIHLPTLLSTAVDKPNYLIHLTGIWLTSWAFTSVLTVVQRFCNTPLTAVIAGYGLLFLVWLIPLLLRQWPEYLTVLDAINILDWYSHTRLGLAYYADISAFFVIILGSLLTGVFMLRTWKIRLRKKLMLVALFALVLIGSRVIPGVRDGTSNQRFSLMPELAEKFSTHQSPLTLISYGLDDFARAEAEARLIDPILNRFNNAKYQIKSAPKVTSEQRADGIEVIWNKQSLWLAYPFTDHPQGQLLKTLTTLYSRQQSFIGFVEGNDEAKIDKQGQRHLSKMASELLSRGFLLNQLSLQQIHEIPNNIQLLVLASPRDTLEQPAINKLMDYLERGGNLLWLRDPEDAEFFKLEDWLGVKKIMGTLMDPTGYQQGTPHPAILLVNQFSEHSITNNLTSMLAFPWATGLSISNNHWQVNQVLKSHTNTWTEWQPNDEQIAFNEELGELRGSFSVLVTLQREQGKNQQRIAVVGDSHFLADMALNNYDNKQLALNLFHWLTQGELSALPKLTKAIDSQLKLSAVTGHMISWFNPFVVPIIFLLTGIWLWRRAKN